MREIDRFNKSIEETPDEGCKYWSGKCEYCPYVLSRDKCLKDIDKDERVKFAGEFLKNIGGLIIFYQKNMEG